MEWQPYSARLRDELYDLRARAETLLDASTIQYRGHKNRGDGIIIVAPDYEWGEPSDELRRQQMATVPLYESWFERYFLLFRHAPQELVSDVSTASAAIHTWLARDDRGWTWDLPSSIEEAKEIISERFAKLGEYLEVVAPAAAEGGEVLAIPDSSALIDVPDLSLYPGALEAEAADIYLVPGVLSEIDALKDQGRNAEVREKARAAGRAIKVLRQHGSLSAGVELRPGVRVFSRPQEPEFESLPGRLDPSVPDDRILAVALELQREHPTAAVVLVTGDINMQTKAEVARLPFAEPPQL